jgi:cyclopropane-fatty-acyl-phospholipid synthase
MIDDLAATEREVQLQLPAEIPWVFSRLLALFLGKVTAGTLVLELPSGARFTHAGTRPGPEARLSLSRWRALRRLLTRGDIGFAEGFMEGDWTTTDLVTLMAWSVANERALTPAWNGQLLGRIADRVRHVFRSNTRRGSRRNIADHYDLGNDFYAMWLDADMNYSSALYAAHDETLETAQQAKLDRVIALLELSPGQNVLEIGCGWGALAERLARGHSCQVTGLTLSREQLDYARRRMHRAGVAARTQILLRDYRDATGAFDRAVSIEMLEAAGEKYWPLYFAKLRDCLKASGIAVLQVITIDEARYADYRRRPDFIQRYIFPGGMLPTAGIIRSLAAEAGLALDHEEQFGESYARTLAAWRANFDGAWPAMRDRNMIDERFKRMWDYYLAYCEVGFRAGALNVGLYRVRKP